MPSSPQKLKYVISLYFSPKVTYPESLYGVKIMKIERSKYHTWAPLNKRAIERNSDYENLTIHSDP